MDQHERHLLHKLKIPLFIINDANLHNKTNLLYKKRGEFVKNRMVNFGAISLDLIKKVFQKISSILPALKVTLILISASFTLISCATSPTGRNQLKLMPEDQMDQLGAQSFEEVKKKTPRSTDRQKISISECVARAVLDKNNLNQKEWEIVVFKSPDVNAFAVPGKKIGVYEGIFKTAKTPDQLAAVLGHEIGHVIAEHGNERVSQQLLIQSGLSVADIFVDSQTPTGKAVIGGLGLGLMVGVALPFSRKHELEADLIGLDYMANAGFDPRQAITLWENMAQLGSQGPQFISTHPNSDARIQQIRDHLNEALALQQKAIERFGKPQCGI